MFLFCFLTKLTAIPTYEEQWPVSIFPDLPVDRVTSLKETAYTVRNNEKIELKKKYAVDYIFDKNGYLDKIEYLNPDGSNAKSVKYIYSNGQLSQKTIEYPEIIYDDNEIFDVSDDGLILTTQKVFSSGNYGWKYKNYYNLNGKIIKTEKFDKFLNWTLIYSRNFEYNDNGLLSCNESFGMDSKLMWRDEYYYDDEGNLNESIKYNAFGDLVVKIKNIFDEYGNFLRREFFDKDNVSYVVYSYIWNYDDRGNWTTKVIGRETEGQDSVYFIPESVVTREIEYCD